MSSATPIVPAPNASHRLSLAAVFAASFGVGLVIGFQPPLIAFVFERQGASSATIGAVNSISTVAVILCGPFFPSAIRRLGLRLATALGMLVSTAVLALMPLLPDLQAWMALRFVTGCALGLEWVASEIWLNRLSSNERRGTVMGTYATVFAAGLMAGPLLLQLTGTSGWRPFGVGAVCLALTALPLLAAREPPPASVSTADRLRWLRIAQAAPTVMLAAAIAGLVESACVALLPIFGLLQGLDERSTLLLVTVFLAGNVILQVPIGRLGDRLGRMPIIGACAVVCMVGPIIFSGIMGTPWLVWPLLLVWGGTIYGFYTQGIALLGESYPSGDLADANTVFIIVYCIGSIVGPLLGGLAMDWWTPHGLLVYLSAAPLLLAAAWWLRAPPAAR